MHWSKVEIALWNGFHQSLPIHRSTDFLRVTPLPPVRRRLGAAFSVRSNLSPIQTTIFQLLYWWFDPKLQENNAF